VLDECILADTRIREGAGSIRMQLKPRVHYEGPSANTMISISTLLLVLKNILTGTRSPIHPAATALHRTAL
jgi:hypothetical protein